MTTDELNTIIQSVNSYNNNNNDINEQMMSNNISSASLTINNTVAS